MTLLAAGELRRYFASYGTAFRAELLPWYDVSSDRNAAGVSDFDRYIAGAPGPDPERKGASLQALRAQLAVPGRRRYRVKAMHNPPTDYERYACEWGYDLNVDAGEEIHVWDLAEHPLPEEARDLPDFWLLDEAFVLVMHYDPERRFIGAEPAPEAALPRFLDACDALVAGAQEFRPWYAARPHLRRRSAAA